MGARSSCKDCDENDRSILSFSLTVAEGPADNVGGAEGGCGSVFTRASPPPGQIRLTVSVFTEVGQAVTKTLALGVATGGDWSLIWDQLVAGGAGTGGPPYCT